jgi:hypothetical protein
LRLVVSLEKFSLNISPLSLLQQCGKRRRVRVVPGAASLGLP